MKDSVNALAFVFGRFINRVTETGVKMVGKRGSSVNLLKGKRIWNGAVKTRSEGSQVQGETATGTVRFSRFAREIIHVLWGR